MDEHVSRKMNLVSKKPAGGIGGGGSVKRGGGGRRNMFNRYLEGVYRSERLYTRARVCVCVHYFQLEQNGKTTRIIYLLDHAH